MVKTGGNDFDFKASFSVKDTDRRSKIKSQITDKIEVTAAIPEPSARYISNDKTWPGINDLFRSSVAKVNSDGNIRKKSYFCRIQFAGR